MTKMLLNGKYEDNDDLCVPFISFFNSIGLKTQFCCQGHELYESFFIIFDKSVTDDMIFDFQRKYWYALDSTFPFYKWSRITTKEEIILRSEEEWNNIQEMEYDERFHCKMDNWVFGLWGNSFRSESEKIDRLKLIYSKLIRIKNQTK